MNNKVLAAIIAVFILGAWGYFFINSRRGISTLFNALLKKQSEKGQSYMWPKGRGEEVAKAVLRQVRY